jgi:hypothetical protein
LRRGLVGTRRCSLRLASSITTTSVVDREDNQTDNSSDDEQGNKAEDIRMDASAQDNSKKTECDEYHQTPASAFEKRLTACWLVHFIA